MIEYLVSLSLLIVVVLLIRGIFRKTVSPRAIYALWLVVVVRMLLPITLVEIDVTLPEFLQSQQAEQSEQTEQLPDDSQSTTEEQIQSPKADLPQTTPTYPSQNTSPVVPVYPPITAVAPDETTPAAPITSEIETDTPLISEEPVSVNRKQIADLVWFIGAVIAAAWVLITSITYNRRLMRDRRFHRTVRGMKVYVSQDAGVPCIAGLIPSIYITPEAADSKSEMLIIIHEYTHIRHGDHIWSIFRALALIVFWWNPLVWIAATASKQDAELACDDAISAKLNDDERLKYARILIDTIPQKHRYATGFGSAPMKERILMLTKRQKNRWICLILAVVLAVSAVGCSFISLNEKTPADIMESAGDDTADSEHEDQQTKTYSGMEEYVAERMAQEKTVTYYSASKFGNTQLEDWSDTANVTDSKIDRLEKMGEVSGLAEEGTLECWRYRYLLRLDVPTEEVVLAGGQDEEDGYYDLEGQNGHTVVALRYADGTYTVLMDEMTGDGLDFTGYRNSYEEAIYDWYVKEYGLDLPLYVQDWTSEITMPEDGNFANQPVHRFDGDGWGVYIPSAWYQVEDTPENQWIWRSLYYTGSSLIVESFDYSLESEFLNAENQGYTPTDDSKKVWESHADGVNSYYYYYENPKGGFWRVMIYWTDEGITDYPYIAIEPQMLRLMADKFVVFRQEISASITANDTLADFANKNPGDSIMYEGYTVEYECESTYGDTFDFHIHLPQLNSNAPSAAEWNQTILRVYEAEFGEQLRKTVHGTNTDRFAHITYNTVTTGDVLTIYIVKGHGILASGASTLDYDIYHYNIKEDRFLSTDEFIAYYAEGQFDDYTVSDIVKFMNDHVFTTDEAGNPYPLTEENILGVIPSVFGDGKFDVVYQGYVVEGRFATRMLFSPYPTHTSDAVYTYRLTYHDYVDCEDKEIYGDPTGYRLLISHRAAGQYDMGYYVDCLFTEDIAERPENYDPVVYGEYYVPIVEDAYGDMYMVIDHETDRGHLNTWIPFDMPDSAQDYYRGVQYKYFSYDRILGGNYRVNQDIAAMVAEVLDAYRNGTDPNELLPASKTEYTPYPLETIRENPTADEIGEIFKTASVGESGIINFGIDLGDGWEMALPIDIGGFGESCQAYFTGVYFAHGTPESESSMQAYQSVLENQTMLYDTSVKQEMLLSDWLNSAGLSIQKYSVIDLNGDNEYEMVLWLDHGNYTDYGFEVLHCENNTVYAYGFPYRGFNDLKADGTYHWSGGAGHHGTAAIDFAGDTYTETNLAYCDDVTDPKTIHYYIGDRLVTKEEFDLYESEQGGKPDAVWVEYTAGN